jgi:hypothetical protein
MTFSPTHSIGFIAIHKKWAKNSVLQNSVKSMWVVTHHLDIHSPLGSIPLIENHCLGLFP